ncbi:hypothetical protein Agub_g8880 [Astrephomene gubernaculifera]|uniref:Uncharacterized protein n=1 Tax=Astrephomene gubernaculifera TaxID=47775 RepID=A0AAD3DSF6_9CHLO|nr:hypothetical protein Agub_g8880 [Astrephomene gubernaculifera]
MFLRGTNLVFLRINGVPNVSESTLFSKCFPPLTPAQDAVNSTVAEARQRFGQGLKPTGVGCIPTHSPSFSTIPHPLYPPPPDHVCPSLREEGRGEEGAEEEKQELQWLKEQFQQEK